MKKLSILLVTGIISCWIANLSAQSRMVITENFDSNTVSFTASPATAWEKETNFYTSPPNAYLGTVPNTRGATTILETPMYNLTNYLNVLLRFKHICKISPRDTVSIEYKIQQQAWKPLFPSSYLGSAFLYQTRGFSALSYVEWQEGDSLAIPTQSWWKEESFDVSVDVGGAADVQFRFIIKHGNTIGTQISYGWLIDDIEIIADMDAVKPPIVEFIAPLVKDTVAYTGPWTINAEVRARTYFQIANPYLVYIVTRNNQITAQDSILMTMVSGDTLWQATIPQFVDGSEVAYSITGKDGNGNYTVNSSKYIVKKGGSEDVIIGTGSTYGSTSPYNSSIDRGWSRAIYYDNEIRIQGTGAYISAIAYNNYSGAATVDSLSIYVKATKETVITQNAYVDPVADTATLVWGEVTYTNTTGWNTFTFHTPFYLPPEYNLMVYWINKDGSSTVSTDWYYTQQPVNNHIRGYGNNQPDLSILQYRAVNGQRPNIKVSEKIVGFSANSAALVSIDSPQEGYTVGNTNTPVTVTIRNKGDSTLTALTFNWSVNGVVKTPYTWTGNLPWDFETQVTIGNYTSLLTGYDTVKVWLSLPNGGSDPITVDDSLTVSSYGCAFALSSPTYIVGNGGTFQTLNDFFSILKYCTPSGDITLALPSGVYTDNLTLANFSDLMGGHTLIITSLANHSDSVIIRPASGNGITLGKVRNLVLKALTVDVAPGTGRSALVFTDTCSYVVIRDCKLLVDTTVTAAVCSPVAKAQAGTGIASNVSFINNLLDGGYIGFFFYGGPNATYMGTNIIFDSNTVSNQRYYAVNPSYLQFISCSYNVILSRRANVATTWTGLMISNSNGPIIGNKILQRSNSITMPCGIYLSLYHYSQTTTRGLVANNEVIINMNGSGNYAALRVGSSSRAEIIHNSLYVTGTGPGRGFHIDNGTSQFLVFKNNNIVTTSSTSHPFYFYSTAAMGYCDMDYNNYYAPQYIGYYSKNRTTLTEWREQIKGDWNSVRISPSFADPTTSLALQNNGGLSCYPYPTVIDDIQFTPRTTALATMGCYELPSMTSGGRLSEIIGLPAGGGSTAGRTDTVKTIVYNSGTTPLTFVNLGWSINGATQNASINYPVTLAAGEADTLTLGTITYIGVEVTVKVWINTLNNGTLTDGFLADDTVSLKILHCANSYSGVYLIGSTGNFSSVQAALDAFRLCGVTGDIILQIQPATYTTGIDLTDNFSIFGNYKLTLTSTSGDATNTIISASPGIKLGNTNNVTIKALTFGTISAAANTYAMDFVGACTNILVRDCRILSNTTATTSNFAIRKTSGTGVADSIFFIKNEINGGYYGFYFVGGTSSTALGTHIVFDSNTVSNQYYYGVYSDYVDFTSCAHNTVLSRSTGTIGTTWYAMYISYSEGPLVGNRIIQRSNTTTSPQGIYLNGYYNGSSDTGLVANNELILYTTGAYTAINGNSTRNVKYINNSIYITGTGAGRGIMPNQYSIIKNNNIVVTSSTGYPIYFNSASVMPPNSLDYNNLYSPNNVGYHGGAVTNMATWRQRTNGDSNSVRIMPAFVNPATSLDFMYTDSLSCFTLPEILTDIRGLPRAAVTNIGAYSTFSNGQDLMLTEVTAWNNEVVDKQTVQVNVTGMNMAVVPISSATFGWSINGQPQTDASWTTVQPLNSTEQTTIPIGTFPVTTANTVYDIVVWVKTINSQADTINWNDTVRASTVLSPLAEFTDPLITDTILSSAFTVNILIREWTGATNSTPQMMLVSTTNGTQVVYDTITMVKVGDIWQANIPPQYHNTKVVYSVKLSDIIGNSITLVDSTFIPDMFTILGSSTWTDLSVAAPLTIPNIVCTGDSSAVNVALQNKSAVDYNFEKDTLLILYEITNPLQDIFSGSVPYTGSVQAGTSSIIELIPSIAVFHAGSYDIKIWMSFPAQRSLHTDTVRYTYISNKIALSVDVNFHNGFPNEFNVNNNNTLDKWTVIARGTGRDTVVQPVFGDSLLSFVGSRGAMTTLATRQMDLSQTRQPSLSFWYFHDTIPCKDYMDVRITIDGGETYTTLYSLTKYDAIYGWRQYNMDLPAYAINQCVMLVFEAMEKSNGDVTQYIDRILITARQDITVSEIITSELNACELENKELRIVLSNLSNPVLDFVTTPVILTLEIKETGETFTHTLTRGSLGSFASDTFTVKTGFDFTKGTYTFKAYFSSVFDVDRDNDTLETSLTINPELKVTLNKISGNNTCLSGESLIHQEINLTNTGNMDLFDIDLILQIDTGQTGDPAYFTLREICTDTIHINDTITYSFISAYKVPWNIDYYPRIYTYLSCDSSLVNATTAIIECVDMEDLYMVSIDNPSTGNDTIGAPIQVAATLRNRSDVSSFSNRNITFVVENSQRVETERFTETIAQIGILATVSHTFANTYTVPDDSVYYLTVYIDNNDNYSANDTLIIERRTEKEDKDLYVVNIDNPSSGKDVVGSSVQVSANVYNGSEYEDFAGINITVLVKNSRGIETITFTEKTGAIGRLSTVNHTFTQSYTVPNDSVYHLTVYIDSYDNYPQNDTARITRYTESVGIAPIGSINAFTLGQNIPNPANKSTRIDYSVPEAGKVIFHIHSISGQLLYSKTIDTKRGTNSIELNTTTFAAGVYFYSMEYKGQRLVKQLIIK